MPEIQAKYNGNTYTGRNAGERGNDNAPPSTAITAKSPALANLMNGLNHHGRSAYACAEAQALAKLFNANNGLNYSTIEFSCPTGEDGLELWHLCDNCLVWLSKKTGFGSTKTFKLSDKALGLLQPAVMAAAPNINSLVEFPPLK